MSVKSDSILESGYSLNSDIKTLELGELVEVQAGGTPDTNEDMYYDGKIPFVSISDMTSSGKYIKTTSSNITEDGLKNSTAVVASDSDVLLSIYASYGKLSLPQNDVSISQAIVRLTIKEEYREEIQREYLYYVLQSMQKVYDRMSAGTTQSNLSKSQIQKLRIPVPPLEEQERIVSLLSDVDEYIEKTSERVNALEQQKQAVLQRVFNSHIDTENNPTLRDYGISFVKGKTPSEDEGAIPYISTGVYRDNDEPEDYTTEDEATIVSQNDIAMLMDGSNSGEVFTGKSGAISSTMAKLNFEEEIYNPYVKALLEWFNPHINANAMGSTIPHTSKKVVARLPVFHTTKENQKKIAEVITKINQEKSTTEEEIESMRELKQGLLQDIFSD